MVGVDLGYIKTVLSHAAAAHGLLLSLESFDLARIALSRLGLVGKLRERDRRPSHDELTLIISAFKEKQRKRMPMESIIRFAIAAASPVSIPQSDCISPRLPREIRRKLFLADRAPSSRRPPLCGSVPSQSSRSVDYTIRWTPFFPAYLSPGRLLSLLL